MQLQTILTLKRAQNDTQCIPKHNFNVSGTVIVSNKNKSVARGDQNPYFGQIRPLVSEQQPYKTS